MSVLDDQLSTRLQQRRTARDRFARPAEGPLPRSPDGPVAETLPGRSPRVTVTVSDLPSRRISSLASLPGLS